MTYGDGRIAAGHASLRGVDPMRSLTMSDERICDYICSELGLTDREQAAAKSLFFEDNPDASLIETASMIKVNTSQLIKMIESAFETMNNWLVENKPARMHTPVAERLAKLRRRFLILQENHANGCNHKRLTTRRH